MANSISTASFYGKSRNQRIRLTDSGIHTETRITNVIVPGDDSSSEEDNSEQALENLGLSNDETFIPDNDVDESSDYDSEDEEQNNDAPQPSGEKSSKNKSKETSYRWQRKLPADVDTMFTGAPFPDPPENELTPIEYFKQFFGNELLDHIVDQSNLYSVQKSGKSVQMTKHELEQYFGILLMMGVIKQPQYRMYWSNGTRIPSIADTMSVGRFDKLKQYLHCNDNTEMLPRDNPNHDKLFKVRPVIDSVLEKCKLLPRKKSTRLMNKSFLQSVELVYDNISQRSHTNGV
ncbi:piggyBac transposable element-derived protein 2-like [Dendronephthya gigantea]|uniref:piggyBac transposable element-derived protein 2-like n=1 Tax=Dendronephthya gigantea TaxID=151771 RepID=UPI001069221F|nr:piggyBac transposable element-derived protein 2-like [Dendronephthya gigantea]